jgi:hypothetical protein
MITFHVRFENRNCNSYPRLRVLLQKQMLTSDRRYIRDLVQSSPLERIRSDPSGNEVRLVYNIILSGTDSTYLFPALTIIYYGYLLGTAEEKIKAGAAFQQFTYC